MASHWLSEILKQVRPAFTQILVVSAFVNLLAIAAPVFVLQVYDRVVMHAGISTLYGLVIGVLVAIVFDFVLRQFRARLLQRAALEIDIGVNRRVLDKLMTVPLRVLEARPVAQWDILFRDANAVRDTLSGPTAVAIADLPFAVIFLGVIYAIAAPVAWVVLMLIPVFVLIAWLGARSQTARNRDERNATLARDGLVGDVIAGRTTIKSLGLDDAFASRWEDAHAEAVDRGLERGRTGDNFVNLGLAVSVIATVAITGVGALAILNQELTIGALIATNMLAARIIMPFHQLVGTWRMAALCRQAIGRLDDLFALSSERAESAISFDRPDGKLVFDGATFRYAPENEPVIDEIRLTLEARGLYAVMGANGSGKTTLLKLAMGLYAPDDGQVLIDDADIGQFSRRDLTRWIGYVPQEIRLFSGSIRDNISAAQPEAPDEDIIRAAKLAGVHEFVAALPDGYGADVGDGGAALPGGIRQKIGIARALLRQPPVLLMDEPSSNLDRDSETALAETLRTLSNDHTIVMATHSLRLLSACHSILVLERGKVRTGGPADKVLPEMFPAAAAVAARKP